MIKYIFMIALACIIAAPAHADESENPAHLFVVVTTADPITQLMSMVLATQALNKGAEVDVLLCGEAGALALEGSPETLLKPNDTSPQMLLRKLLDKGVAVELCPPYLPNKGKTAADLVAGVAVAKPPLVAEKLLREETKILSY